LSGFSTIVLRGWGLLAPRPTPNVGDQASVFMTPGGRVAKLYPQAPGTHFIRLLRWAWVRKNTIGIMRFVKNKTAQIKET
jgi:hypothetical protein